MIYDDMNALQCS